MGCLASTFRRLSDLTERARKRSSVWATIDITSSILNAEDWTSVFAVSNLIRSQGIDVDVVMCTFERLFSKHPKIKSIFIDAGILVQLEESKMDPRLRAHIREIVGSLNRILELKGSDPDALEPYLREIRELHRRIKGFHFSYFEMFAHCYEYSFLNLVGPAVSRQQKDAYRKFIIYLVKLLCKDENLTTVSRASNSARKPGATQNRKSLRQADKIYSRTKQRKSNASRQEEEWTVSTADEQEAGDDTKTEISTAASNSTRRHLKPVNEMQGATQDRKNLRQADQKYSGTKQRKSNESRQEEYTVSTADKQEVRDETNNEISTACEREADTDTNAELIRKAHQGHKK